MLTEGLAETREKHQDLVEAAEAGLKETEQLREELRELREAQAAMASQLGKATEMLERLAGAKLELAA